MNARRLLQLLFVAVATLAPLTHSRAGTLVHFSTNIASFEVELYDLSMPTTVANFLSYVSGSAYSSTLIQRSTTYNPNGIQIIQGGGWKLTSGNQLFPVATGSSIPLETGTAVNARGTIAMARGAATDSATSQYYFNLQDNVGLDGNYAVFGNVVGEAGLAALDAIGAVTVYDCRMQLGEQFGELPLTAASLDPSSLVLINSVAPVPEPSTILVAAAGIAAAVGSRRPKTGAHL